MELSEIVQEMYLKHPVSSARQGALSLQEAGISLFDIISLAGTRPALPGRKEENSNAVAHSCLSWKYSYKRGEMCSKMVVFFSSFDRGCF